MIFSFCTCCKKDLSVENLFSLFPFFPSSVELVLFSVVVVVVMMEEVAVEKFLVGMETVGEEGGGEPEPEAEG